MQIMNNLLEYKYDILASLYIIPCSLEELCSRDFCRNLPIWAVDKFLYRLEMDGYIKKTQSGIYRTIKKKARRKLNELGYEIE